ncbi:MAG: trigger factor [Clostridiaceae bacterium]|nr:trigger factor [Clostridiaceae bacterium]
MASVLEKKADNVVLLTIDVTPEAFADALQRSFKKNVNKFAIPGFRKGKAPMGLVTKYYGEGVLYDDAIEFAATPAYTAAIAEHGIEPVSRPEMDILDIGRDKGIKFTITVTVKPDVTLGQYLGVEAVKPEFPVTDDDVEKELSRVQERNSRMIPAEDRPVQDGDTANIDYEGFLDGKPFDGGKGAAYDLKIGSKTFIPGFEDQVIGHNAGESFDINITFPEDYNSDELKGKAVVFQVKINSVKIRELPVLDDDFAKDVSEFDTLAEYKESLRTKLLENNNKRAAGIFEENVIKAVSANAAVDIPHVMIDNEIDQMVDEQKNQMHYQGIELEQYLGYVGQTMETFKEQLHEPAESRVKTRLVLEAIAKAENMTADDAEVDAEIERMAAMYNMKADDLKSRLPSGESSFVHESVISRKTVERLTAQAVPVAPPAEPEKAEAGETAEAGEAEPEETAAPAAEEAKTDSEN